MGREGKGGLDIRLQREGKEGFGGGGERKVRTDLRGSQDCVE
jgi:hypothetical protein